LAIVVSMPCMIGANIIEIVIAPRLAGAAASPLTASPLTVGLPLNRACGHRHSGLNLNDTPMCCSWLQTDDVLALSLRRSASLSSLETSREPDELIRESLLRTADRLAAVRTVSSSPSAPWRRT
jgi:hypothetical protein